jgi:hypothetical protein
MTAAERFELARRSTPELTAFLRRMPKGADLHNHLGGALRADFLIATAKAGYARPRVPHKAPFITNGGGSARQPWPARSDSTGC